MIAVSGPAFVLEADPALRDEPRQPLLGLVGDWGRSVESAADFRRVDAEQPNASNAGDIDGVTVDDEAH